MALDVIADKTWDEIDKTWDEFTLETWDGWVEFSYTLKIHRPEMFNTVSNFSVGAYYSWQGVATDGTYLYVLTDRNAAFGLENIISKYDLDGNLQARNSAAYDPFPAGDFFSFGDGNVIGGKLYVTAYNANDPTHGPLTSRIAVFKLSDLSYIEDFAIGDVQVAEGIDTYDGSFWVVDGQASNGETGKVYKYNSSFTLLAEYTLNASVTGTNRYQSLCWKDEYIYLNVHAGSTPLNVDRYRWDGSKFTITRRYDAPTSCNQGMCLTGSDWYFADRVNHKIVKTDLSTTKIAEISGDLKNPTLTSLNFELLQQGGCGTFSFTLAKPYTQATISYDYRVDIHFFHLSIPWYSGKIINLPKEGTDKKQTYSGWGYFNEMEKKIINTEISPGSDIAVAATSLLDTHIVPYTSILKDATLIETVGHPMVATYDFEDEYAKEIFNRLTELAVDYKFGVNENRKFYFQAIDTSVSYYWHVGKHLTTFLPEEDPSGIVKKVIAVYPEVFTDGYRLKITAEATDYAGFYDKRFSLPEIVNPLSTTNRAQGTPTTSPTGTGAANLCDGDNSTLWESDANQASGHYIIVDLGADYDNVAAVVIDSIDDNAQQYNAKSIKIEVKPDEGSYTEMLSSDDDIGWKPTLTFRPTKARYVKISLTGSSSEEWKVGEVEVYQLDLTDAQRWADWKLTTLESVRKRAIARITNVQSLIMDSTGLVPMKPKGKARIFDRNGTKIDDYQIMACKYSLSSRGFSLDLELGTEKPSVADEMKDMERRIRENENSGVRRAKNLSLSTGFQLSKITGTYIGKDAIETKHLRALSITAEKYYELRNTYVFSDQDSLDASYPFEIDFEIVSEMTAIQKVLLSFRIRNFRAYSTTVPAGGGHTTPSGGGHTTPSGGGHTTPSGGGATSSSSTHDHPGSTASGGGSHEHRINIGVGTSGGAVLHDYSAKIFIADMAGTSYVDTQSATGSHDHSLNITADGAHTHTTPDHTHEVSNHTHTVSNHTHTVSNHTHSLTFGIYEEVQSPTIHYHIDNGAGYGGASGNYTTDQLDLDITSSISGTGFKRIKFDSDLRTRISAWVLCKVDLTA